MTPRILSSYCLIIAALLAPQAAHAQGARLRLRSSQQARRESDRDGRRERRHRPCSSRQRAFWRAKDRTPRRCGDYYGGITGIYVKSFEFDAPNMYAESDVEAIRKQVSGSGWSRVISVREKGKLTEIYFWRDGDTTGGLVVISAETNNGLTVVNIVGRVNLASLGALGPMIPKMPGALGKGTPK